MSATRPRDRTSAPLPQPRITTGEDTPSPSRSPRREIHRRAPSGRRRIRWGRLTLLSGGVICVLASVAAAGMWYLADRQLEEIPKAALEEGTLAAPEPDRPRNFLVIGSDSREGSVLRDPSLYGERRADTTLLVHVEPASGETTVLSLPRDTRVEIPGHGTGKLNSAYAIGGAPLAIATVKRFTGLPIHHYVEINFDGLVGLVDALGGVDVCIDKPMRDPTYNIWMGSVGCHHLDGFKALQFTRSRQMQILEGGKWVTDPTADIGRIHRQQLFVKAILKKGSSIREIGRWQQILDGLKRGITIDNGIDLGVVVDLYDRLRDIDTGRTKMMTLPGEPRMIADVSYWSTDYNAAAEIFSSMGSGEPARVPEHGPPVTADRAER